MYTVTITKDDTVVETQHFAYLTMFALWLEGKGSVWLNDGHVIQIVKGTPS
jgi:hypothetical protein